MNILRAPFQSKFKTRSFTAVAATIALAVGSLTAASPANATPFTGLVSCSGGTSARAVESVLIDSSTCVGSLEIPAVVTSLADGAFKNSGVTRVTFEPGSTLTAIGMSAFEGTRISAIKIPAGVTSIGSFAFKNATSLSSVTFMSGSVLADIGASAFEGVANLPEIAVPASVTSIGGRAFYGASKLDLVFFAGEDPTVGGDAFTGVKTTAIAQVLNEASGYGVIGALWNGLNVQTDVAVPCQTSDTRIVGFITLVGATAVSSNLAGDPLTDSCTIRIPNTVSAVGDNALMGAAVVSSVILPVGLRSLGVNAFRSATNLETVSFADQSQSELSTIGRSAFEGASKLTEFFVPSKVSEISSMAFRFATNLIDVAFDSNSAMTAIGSDAFSYSGLKTIVIPAGVNSIGNSAFMDTAALESVTFLALSEPSFVAFDAFTRAREGALAIIPATSTLGNTGDNWEGLVVQKEGQIKCTSGYFLLTQGGTILHGTDPASPCTGEATIPNTVEEIAANAFDGTFALPLTSVVFESPSSVEVIDVYAFQGASNLTSIAIPASVTYIADGAFAGATQLREVSFLGLTPETGTEPFADVAANAKAFVPSGVTANVTDPSVDFGSSGETWNGLYVIKSPDIACAQNGFVTVSGTVLRDGPECVGSVAIPSSVTEISARAFAGSVVPGISFLEDSALTTIGESAFEGALSLDRLSLAANVSFIGANAFKNTPGLKYFTVDGDNSSFSSSADQVLFNRSKSKLIAYPAARPVNTNRQYTGPSTQASYNVPATVTEIAESAFYNASNIREIIFPGDAPTVGADAFYGVGAGATAKVTLNATGFGDGPTWNGLTIVRAAAPSVPSPGSTSVTPPVVTPPVVVAPKPVAKPIALNQIVAKLLANGVPVLKGRSASKQVEFTASSARLDATDWATLRKVAAGFTGKKGKLILVGFVNGKGQTKGSAQKVAAARAKNVAMALVSLGVDFEIGYAGFGTRNKANPTAVDNRVDFRWIAAE